MGNPLTFHDPVSSTYGSARFGHNEGFHGQLVTRFGPLEGKAWYRDIREAERDFFQSSASCTRWQWNSGVPSEASAPPTRDACSSGVLRRPHRWS